MFERVIRHLVERAGKNHTAPYRAVATVLGAALFLAGWPALIYLSGRLFSAAVFPVSLTRFLAAAFFCLGVPWIGWSVLWQLWRGKGTPVPVVPTKHFLQSGPYRCLRNPMMFGHFLYLLGWAALFNQAGAYLFAVILEALLICEIKWIEERELEGRFGEAYRQYKKETPFFLPRIL